MICEIRSTYILQYFPHLWTLSWLAKTDFRIQQNIKTYNYKHTGDKSNSNDTRTNDVFRVFFSNAIDLIIALERCCTVMHNICVVMIQSHDTIAMIQSHLHRSNIPTLNYEGDKI